MKTAPIQTEGDLWQDIQLLSTEIEDAVTIFHTYEELNRLAAEDSEMLERFNEDALFWSTHQYSLQLSLFIIISRIFDSAPDARSIHRVVNGVIAHPEFFSAEAMAARKSRIRSITPDMIELLLERAWIPTTSKDLRFLKKGLSPHSQRVSDIYRPIRTAIFAHRLMTNEEAAAEGLFSKTNRTELGTSLDFVHELIDALQMFYQNGHRPEVGVRSYEEYNRRIRAGAKRVYRRLLVLQSPFSADALEQEVNKNN